jgi:hypothetical protein
VHITLPYITLHYITLLLYYISFSINKVANITMVHNAGPRESPATPSPHQASPSAQPVAPQAGRRTGPARLSCPPLEGRRRAAAARLTAAAGGLASSADPAATGGSGLRIRRGTPGGATRPRRWRTSTPRASNRPTIREGCNNQNPKENMLLSLALRIAKAQ